MADEKCWYTLDAASQPVGPYSIADLTGYANSGFVLETQPFWKEGKTSWDKLAEVPELASVLKAAREFKPPAAAAGAKQRQSPAQHHPHVKVIAAKPSDPLEAFKQQIAAVEAGVDAAADATADDDREQTPDELEFEDDDGTLYRWDQKLRKYIPAAEADAIAAAAAAAAAGQSDPTAADQGPTDPQQQRQQQGSAAAAAGGGAGDYDIEAMTFVQEEEFIPTLAAARAAEEAAAAKDDKQNNKRAAENEAGNQKGKKQKGNAPPPAAAAAKQESAAAPEQASAAAAPAPAAGEAGLDSASADKQQQEQQEPKGWFELKVNTSVYVTGLPDDTDVDEVAGFFAKCGIIKLDDEAKPKVKLYRDKDTGLLKGDGLVTYLKEPSVLLACQILDGDSLRPGGPPLSVTPARFEMKGGQYQAKKKGGQNNKSNNKGKGKKKKPFTQQDKLEKKLGWYGFDDVLPPEKVTVVLKHMFTAAEAEAGGASFATDLEAEVLAEATKLGLVEKPGKVVILLSGRYAGKKAVIVKNHDDGTSTRGYGHALVCGLAKEPRKVTKRSTAKVQARRSSVKTFIKVVNYNHIMPTRYTLDVDLKGVVTPEVNENSSKKTDANKEAKKLFEEKFKSGKNRWFFTKLRF